MTKQGKPKRTNELKKITHYAQQGAEGIVVEGREFWQAQPKIRKICLTVLFLATTIFIFTLFFEQKPHQQVEVSVPIKIKPIADTTISQENKLTGGVLPSYDTGSLENQPVTAIDKPNLEKPTFVEPEQAQVEEQAEAKYTAEVEYQPELVISNTNEAAPSDWQSYTITSGDTMASIFRDRQLALSDLYALAAIEGEGKPLSRIRPNQQLRFKLSESATLDALEIKAGGRNILFVRSAEGQFVRQD